MNLKGGEYYLQVISLTACADLNFWHWGKYSGDLQFDPCLGGVEQHSSPCYMGGELARREVEPPLSPPSPPPQAGSVDEWREVL